MDAPCPNCGYCPHCGRGGHGHGPNPRWPPRIWMGSQTITSNDSSDTGFTEDWAELQTNNSAVKYELADDG